MLRFRMRITALRERQRLAGSAAEADALSRRIAELQALLRQSRELSELTRRYYERGYHRDGRYTV